MSLWLEQKYTSLLGPHLERFKMGKGVASFRCPICGDSKINKYKTRGTIILKKRAFFYCHNCHKSHKFDEFLKIVSPTLYDEFLKEILVEKYSEKKSAEEAKDREFQTKTTFDQAKVKGITKISQLRADHPAKLYVQNRLIPSKEHYRLYYTPKFKLWTNSLAPGKFETLEYDEPRLIIPLLDENSKLFGFQGRSFKKDAKLRYISIMLDEDMPKIFGLDKLDKSKPVRAVEGPLDSLFVDNCLASAGGKIKSEIEKLGIPPSQITIIYDNEARNKTVCDDMAQCIDDGYNVLIWPTDNPYKDINLMVENGLQIDDRYIKNHTYSGIRAKLELQKWRKS